MFLQTAGGTADSHTIKLFCPSYFSLSYGMEYHVHTTDSKDEIHGFPIAKIPLFTGNFYCDQCLADEPECNAKNGAETGPDQCLQPATGKESLTAATGQKSYPGTDGEAKNKNPP